MELKCKNCGEKFEAKENEEIVKKEIFINSSGGYEKKIEKRRIPKCPKCSSRSYEPTSIPAEDLLTRAQALRKTR